jgi:2-dehydro-3-deoxyphosphogluconate aldolase/(4S)-4-hydroxy-2-oxoglutarate aldolase
MAQDIFSTIPEAMKKTGIVPVFYHDEAETCKRIVEVSYNAGIRVFEFTKRGENALKNFKVLAEYVKGFDGLYLGIGTIFKSEDARKFAKAGAQFIVSPALVPEISYVAAEMAVPWIPGCGTVTEVYTAHNMGAALVKVYPGNVLGAQFVQAVLAVLPQIGIMPTGGVTPTSENLAAWFNSGVHCVGMGSQLFKNDLIRSRQYDILEDTIRKALSLVAEIRG